MANYTPASPSQYKEDQIILNSGRLLFNAKSDSILLFASKAIGFSSAGTINFDSDNNIILNSETVIELGLNAYLNGQGEPVLLGNKTCTNLSSVIQELIDLCNSLTTLVTNPPNLQINAQAGKVAAKLTQLKAEVDTDSLKSKKTYTL